MVILHVWVSFSNCGLALWPFVFCGFIVLLAILGALIYRQDAKENFYFSYVWGKFLAGLMPPTIPISFALGSILLGFATPAEAAMGAFGAILLSITYQKFTIGAFFFKHDQSAGNDRTDHVPSRGVKFFGAEISTLGTPKLMTEALL